MIRLEAGGFNLEDVSLLGPNVIGSGVAIRDIGKTPAGADRAIVGHSFRRVTILSTASWGMELVPTIGTGGIWDISLQDVTIYDAKSGGSFKAGLTGESCVQITCINCDFNGPGFGTYGPGGMTRGALHLENATQNTFINCFFQPSNFSTAVSIDKGNDNRFVDCHFESGTLGGDLGQWWITTSGAVVRLIIENSHINGSAHTGPPRLLKTDNTNSQLVDAVMRDCTIVHLEASTPTDDIVLGNAGDGILLSNNRLFNVNTGVGREIAYTNLPAVGLVLGQAPAWQLRIPGISSTSVVTRPTDGAIIWDATAHKLMVYENGTWKAVQTSPGVLVLPKSADQTNSTTTAADVTDLTVVLAASEVIHFHAFLIASANSTNTGIQTAINGPASPTQVDATIIGWTSATALAATGVNGFDNFQGNTTSAGTTRRVFEISGRVINGPTAGTFALRFRSEVVLNAVTIHRGSWLQYYKGAN